MIEVFKIIHNIYDTSVSSDLSFNEGANIRCNNYKRSAVGEIGDRLDTIHSGRKLGAVPPLFVGGGS